jgi:hypothetical protein
MLKLPTETVTPINIRRKENTADMFANLFILGVFSEINLSIIKVS